MRARIWNDWSIDGHRLYIIQDTDERGKSGQIIKVASGFTWEDHPEGDAFGIADGIGHANGLIQSIMNEAWEKNYRPTGFTDIRNETAALREHLADMKTIAFHQLKIPNAR